MEKFPTDKAGQDLWIACATETMMIVLKSQSQFNYARAAEHAAQAADELVKQRNAR